MWPLVRQARFLGRYRQIAGILSSYGFGYMLKQLGLGSLLRLPQRVLRRPAPELLDGPQRLRMALIELGPTYIKLGQMMSTRPDIVPPEFLTELNQLQDTVPPFSSEQSLRIIEADLGQPIDKLFASFEPEPFAAASLGQVHAATLRDGSQVVVKVQRPDIQHVVAVDLAIITELAELAEQRSELGQRYHVADLAWEFANLLRAELDFRQEGRNADRFRRNFEGSRAVHIPRIYWELTSTRVLTSERLFGIKITDIQGMDACGLDRKRLAKNSVELILQEIFKDGFFQGDPHPGNMFALPGEVIGAVDFGQAIALDRETTQGLLQLLMSLSNYDATGALRALQRLNILSSREITPPLRRDMIRFIDRFVDRPLADISARETGEELFALVQRHRLLMPAQLALLLKAIVMMEGIGVQIDPKLDVFALARPYALENVRDTISPEAALRHLLGRGRELTEFADTLPHLGNVMQLLDQGELMVRTRETNEHLSEALNRTGIRVALAFVLFSSILGLGSLAIATALGHWSGLLVLSFLALGIAAMISSGLALLVSLLKK